MRSFTPAPAPSPAHGAATPGAAAPGSGSAHCDALHEALARFRQEAALLDVWGRELAGRLGAGARLLVAGNGGSAAQAQHLTAELVGRYREDRPAYSALALHADTSSTTAIANDYGVQAVFARQVRAHGRADDVLMLLSTSGASANLLTAAEEARALGLTVWSLTGPAPNPLAPASDAALCVDAPVAATVQELHLVAVHMLCEAFDAALTAEDVAVEGLASGDVAVEGLASGDVAVEGLTTGEGLAAGDGGAAGLSGPDGKPDGKGGTA